MAHRYEVLAGTHYVGETPYARGEVVVSDDDLVKNQGNQKFKDLGEVVVEEKPDAKKAEDKKGK